MDYNQIVNVINSSGLVLAPSDTVYGLLGDATNEIAINKVFEAKKRDKNKSLIMLVNSIDMLKEYVSDLSLLEEELIKEFWPGKLTLILKRNDKVNDLMCGGKSTIAVRYPDNKFLLNVLSKVNKALFSTSANISNQDTITNVEKIDDELLKYIDLVVDGGEIKATSSTIVLCEDNDINILREGELAPKILKWRNDHER